MASRPSSVLPARTWPRVYWLSRPASGNHIAICNWAAAVEPAVSAADRLGAVMLVCGVGRDGAIRRHSPCLSWGRSQDERRLGWPGDSDPRGSRGGRDGVWVQSWMRGWFSPTERVR